MIDRRPAMRVLAVVLALAPAAACGGHHGGSGDIGRRAPVGAPKPTSPLIRKAVWSHPSEGYRLHVTPSAAGRRQAAQEPQRALRQALARSRPYPVPVRGQVLGSLLNQLKCHAEFAATKPRWNLEAWRPDVGYARTVAALCNPA